MAYPVFERGHEIRRGRRAVRRLHTFKRVLTGRQRLAIAEYRPALALRRQEPDVRSRVAVRGGHLPFGVALRRNIVLRTSRG
jgi:hypothetical protein